MTDWIGRTLGNVYIEALLARGGMAEVYLGTHTTLQRKVAVKILRNYNTDDIAPLERFELEARAVARLRHPNIVQVFDFDSIEDQPYIVMEYIPGPSLAKYLRALHAKNGRLGLPLINQLLTRIAGALQYAHDSGVIHRDIKPGNILLTSRSTQILPGGTIPLDVQPVLTDFGLVRFLNSSRQTASGLITGTPAYMSPEQALGEATDGRTDIYSLGVVLYELLSGKVPFDGETTMSILFKHLNETPPPIPGLSPPLQEVLNRALAKSAEDRFQTPEEFATVFNTALEDRSEASTLVTVPQAAKTAQAEPLTSSRRPMHWLPATLVGASMLFLTLSLLYNWLLPAAKGGTSATSETNGANTPLVGIPVTTGPGSILHFQDGNAILDQATLVAQDMPAPPVGSQYKVWLVGGTERLPLGVLSVDGTGKGELTFEGPQNQNLLATYDRLEIMVEPNSDPANSTNTMYSSSLPEPGLTYLRALMVSFPGISEGGGLIHGLAANAKLVDEAAKQMLDDDKNGNEDGARKNAESMMNLLAGNESQDHKDWNGDGQVTDPGDGYGLLLNGDHLGYVKAVYANADYAVNSSGATRNMIVNGENVKGCTQSLDRQVSELRDLLWTILDSTTLSNMDSPIQRSAELANQILNGVDRDENGTIDPVSEECGVLAAYEYTYHMADMFLLPVPVTPQAVSTETITPTVTVTPSSLIFVTPTRQPNGNQSPATVAPAPGNNQPRPTKKPKDNPGQDHKPPKDKP